MNIIEFIETSYPIKDKILARLQDPYKRIADSDDLPYDVIGPDDNGVVTKLVEVDENRFISVSDLIGFSRSEVVASKDVALLEVYDAYMSQIDLTDLNIIDILECVHTHKNIVNERKAKLDVLSVQES